VYFVKVQKQISTNRKYVGGSNINTVAICTLDREARSSRNTGLLAVITY
jgi:hypothetical protein